MTLYFGRLFCEMGSVCCSPVGCAQPEGALIMWVQFPSICLLYLLMVASPGNGGCPGGRMSCTLVSSTRSSSYSAYAGINVQMIQYLDGFNS